MIAALFLRYGFFFLSRYTNKLYCDITAIVYDVTEHVHFLLVDSRFVCQLDVFGA